MNRTLCLLALSLVIAQCALAQMRIFRDQQGRDVMAEILAVSGDRVTLRMAGGREVSVPANYFEDKDFEGHDSRNYVRSWLPEQQLPVLAQANSGRVDVSGWNTTDWSEEVDGLKVRLRAPAQLFVCQTQAVSANPKGGELVQVEVMNSSGKPKVVALQEEVFFWAGRHDKGQLLQMCLNSAPAAQFRRVRLAPNGVASFLRVLSGEAVLASENNVPNLLASHQLVVSWGTNHQLRTPPLPVKFVETAESSAKIDVFLRRHLKDLPLLKVNRSDKDWKFDQAISDDNCPATLFHQGRLYRAFRFQAQPGVLVWAFAAESVDQWYILAANPSVVEPQFPDFIQIRDPAERPLHYDRGTIVIQAARDSLIPGQEYVIWMKVFNPRPIPISLNFTRKFTSTSDYFARMIPKP